jgi:hypothetical protein
MQRFALYLQIFLYQLPGPGAISLAFGLGSHIPYGKQAELGMGKICTLGAGLLSG